MLGKDYFSSNEEVSITKERLAGLLAQAEKICEDEEKVSLLRAIKELQKKIFKQQVSFLKYTPGLEFGKRAGTELGKKALQVSGGIMRKGFRMALAKGAI